MHHRDTDICVSLCVLCSLGIVQNFKHKESVIKNAVDINYTNLGCQFFALKAFNYFNFLTLKAGAQHCNNCQQQENTPERDTMGNKRPSAPWWSWAVSWPSLSSTGGPEWYLNGQLHGCASGSKDHLELPLSFNYLQENVTACKIPTFAALSAEKKKLPLWLHSCHLS